MASSSKLIEQAIRRLQPQLPALANLKLVFGLELTTSGLAGPLKSERFRVELPGPAVGEGEPGDSRLALSMPQAMFNLLAEEGELADWKEAYHYGHLRVEGDPRVVRLLGKAIGRAAD